ncbi:MAG: SRPBCC family protein, partial [Actinomycetota bacterium]|nr:SRPBCC family protein [Actinomycetota bacterium]
MDLNHDFTVDLPVDEAWSLLTDLERVAPCMPGATLESVEGGTYTGTVKVKVGPVTAQYRGTVAFTERDEERRRAVLRAEGRETKGQGNASATITATLRPESGATAVSITTELAVTGRVAQFGRGVIAEVSSRLLQQFVECLSLDVLATGGAVVPDGSHGAPPGQDAGAVADGEGTSPGPSEASSDGVVTRPVGPGGRAPVDAVDVLALVRSMLSTRAKAVAGVAAAALL